EIFQQQELIELIREGKIEQALIFAQENLAEKGEQNQNLLNELEQTMALLAFEQPEKSPFGQLMHFSQRE
uniref:CTLH domain-containing protein n=1 Tax=Romanomermis culicivorax TaxID=13658 RepID=A0A915IF42_ROMCU